MKRVLERIAERKAHFAALALFRRLEGEGTVDDVRAFAPGLTFFVMVFQDMLRLNAARVVDPALAAFARKHRDEDAGHDAWFLHDLRELNARVGVGALFGPEHEITRNTAYALIAESVCLNDDLARIAMLFALEATGDAIFRRAPGFLERAGFRGKMLYFSRRHYDVESAHDLHDAGIASALSETVLDSPRLAAVLALVELAFDAMTTMVNELEARVVRARLRPTSQPSGIVSAAETREG